MLKPVAPAEGAVRPLVQAGVLQELVLLPERLTEGFDLGYRDVQPRRHRGGGKHVARHAGHFQDVLRVRGEPLEPFGNQQLQGVRQGGDRAQGGAERPPGALLFHHPLLHQVLQQVHQEQGVALRVVIQQRHQLRCHLPPQPRRRIRLDIVGEEQLQRQVVADSPPPQLLEHPAQRVRPHHHVHRAIRPQHEEPGWVAPLRQVGEQVHRGHITPVQVFEHQHQGGGPGQGLQGLRQLAQHPPGRHVRELPLEALALIVTEQHG